jgi:hypothetical protein
MSYIIGSERVKFNAVTIEGTRRVSGHPVTFEGLGVDDLRFVVHPTVRLKGGVRRYQTWTVSEESTGRSIAYCCLDEDEACEEAERKIRKKGSAVVRASIQRTLEAQGESDEREA